MSASASFEEFALLEELEKRLTARQSLQGFIEYNRPRWRPGKIHRAICEQLDRVRRKEIDRLLLLCPPQHGKSEITSREFPAYMLGNEPDEDWISASASAQLAEDFGRDVRDRMNSRTYRNTFPGVQLAEDSQARGKWNTRQGGSYYAVGIGGDLFGRGGGAIIDDPFGSWKDAQSEVERNKVWTWYQGTLYNRIRPGRPIVLIQHRMHEDDLAGRVIEKAKAGGDKFTIVELPADVNDPPWPERYDRAALERIRANMDVRMWSALYMQNPTPEEGTFFKREWFDFVDPKKAVGHAYSSGDFATRDGAGDFTSLGTHRYSGDTLVLGVDGWRGQETADKWFERLIDQFARHKPMCFFGEGGPIRRSVEPFLRRRMQERRTFCRLEWLPRTHDKATMARPLQAMAASGKVKIADTEFGHNLLAQLLQFPAGMRDDDVDMAALMALAIDQAHPALIQALAPPKRADRWDDEETSASWKTA